MSLQLLLRGSIHRLSTPLNSLVTSNSRAANMVHRASEISSFRRPKALQRWRRQGPPAAVTTNQRRTISAALPPLDLTEDNVKRVLADARVELGQLFDGSVGITGQAELAELDGPFVKISLRGRFWHKRSTVLERLANYLKQRIPEILEVDIEDEKQLDDSPENF
ncbi:hypothetical protein NMG60_11003288 [Bertholletia excelsa]